MYEPVGITHFLYGMRIDVKTVVEIPRFLVPGVLSADGIVLVELDDVCAYLTRVAAACDSAHANRDVSLSIRAIRDGLAAHSVTPVEGDFDS